MTGHLDANWPRPEDQRPGHDVGEGAARTRVTLIPPDPNKLNWRRGILVGASMISSLLIIMMIAVVVLTGTDWGRERVRRYAEGFLNNIVHGRVTIGRLSGNLLVGMTVHNLTITDSASQPFIAVESFKGNYSIMSLLRKRIWIDGAVAVRPLIVLDRPPKQPWNWQRLFPRDTVPKPPSTQNGWLDWVRFTNAVVVNGQLVVRTPWAPSERLSRTAQDSVIRDALRGGGRLMIRPATGGYQKVVQLDSMTAAIPFLRLSQPGVSYRLVEISSLTMVAFPFRPPAAVVRDLRGVFPFTNDSVWWKGAYAALPHSRASGSGTYNLNSGDLTLSVHSDPASFADMRWVYPRLPANGIGKLDLALAWRGAVQDYQISNADIHMGSAHAAGRFGITLSDTIAIHDTNLRFAGVDTRTLEQLIPHFTSPRRGVFAGRAAVSGGRNALAVNGDVTFDDQQAGQSRIVALGHVGFPGRGIRASDLRVQMLPIQVAMARTWIPSLPIAGTVTGSATLNGTTGQELTVAANIDHRDRGTRSVMEGKATVRFAPASWFDVDVTTRPVSLVEVGRFAPSVGLQGSAAGPVHLTGTLQDLRVAADLRLPDGGRFNTRGTLGLAGADKAYDLTSSLYTLDLRTIDSKAPVTSLTAHAVVKGRGTQLATMRASVAADLSTSRWDSIAVDTMSVRASVADGLADIQRLDAAGAHSTAHMSGTFGLTGARSGTLAYRVSVDSLGAFNRWIPRPAAAAKPIPPRPAVVARAMRQARADSTRLAKATEVERAITGAPGPRLNAKLPQPVPADTLAGRVYAAGQLSGNIDAFTLTGRASGDSVVARGNYVRRFQAVFDWTNARTPDAKLVFAADVDSISAMGFAFDTANVRLTYSAPVSGGHVELAVTQDKNRQYGVKGDYAFHPDRSELRLVDMSFRFDTAYWFMPHPGVVHWGGPGIEVVDFELRNRGNGRLYANGLLPTSGVADFVLDVDNFPVSNVVDITQSDISMSGVATLHGAMTGTLAAPAFRGAFGLVGGTYNGTVVPDLEGRFGYADRELVTHVDALRPTGPRVSITTVDGRIPINLALSGVTGSRILPDPMAVDVVADSLPLELIPQFTDVVTDLHGRAAGKVSLRGTLNRPSLVGAMTLDHGSVRIAASGAKIESLAASLRMANDTVWIDSIAGWAKGPVRVRGTLGVGTWREPSFNLYLVSSGAQLMDNEYAQVRVDAGLALTGPFRAAYLSGAATVTGGVIYAPEPGTRHTLIGAGDPALFNVLDTAMANERTLFPAESPLLQNVRVDVAMTVKPDTWVRNREANVEIYTDDPLLIHQEADALTLTGVVTTDRGEYDTMSKRFQVKRGSAMFVGSPDLNPTLQVTGEYQVQVASRGAVNIRVIVGGTLRRPKISLESDAQPPKTQSELLSLLAFGQNTTSLLSSGASSIAGTAATSDLFGVGAQVAAQRLASVAAGVAVQQVEVQAGRAFGTDVFDITPGDVPFFAGGNAVGNFFTQTKVEAGKYVNPRTYVGAQEQASKLGVSIEHRTADGWHFTGSIEPRILLLEPRLNGPSYRTVQSYGGFVIREWRF